MKVAKSLFLTFAAALPLAGCVEPGGGRTGAASPPVTAPAATPAPASPPANASAPNPTVGGAAMRPDRTIVENASTAPNLTTWVAAVKAAGLAGTLSGPGPFTVFAPTNEAFARLAPGTMDTLLRPENRASLAKVLNHHLVRGGLSTVQLVQRIQAAGGAAQLTTVAGETLTARVEGGVVSLTDSNGIKSYVETPDVRQSNGVVHVINGVLVPPLG